MIDVEKIKKKTLWRKYVLQWGAYHRVHNSSSQDFLANFAHFFLPNFGEIWLKIGEIWLYSSSQKIPGLMSYPCLLYKKNCFYLKAGCSQKKYLNCRVICQPPKFFCKIKNVRKIFF